MSPADFVPRPDENFSSWLRRVDSATAELIHQDEPLVDQHAAYRVGNAMGSWPTLFDCLDDTVDARELLTLALAQQLGHRDLKTTQVYARVTDDLVKREAARVYAQRNRVPGTPAGAKKERQEGA